MVDLATAADVSTTTLKHYFGDRDELYAAVLEAVRTGSEVLLRQAATAGGRPPEQTLPSLLLGTVAAWRQFGLGPVFTGGLALGLGSPARGAHFLKGLLEPFLQACETLLAAHCACGDLPRATEDELRAGALALVSPLLLALLHQDALGGRGVRRLDVEDLARRHAELVLTGLRAGPS